MKGQIKPFIGFVVLSLVMTLGFSSVNPAFAQQDQPTPTPGAGNQGGQQGQTQSYTVQQGETLTDIADRFGVTLEELVRLNPNLLQAGATINVPAQQGQVPQTGQDSGSFALQTGDTLGSILGRFELTELQIQEFLLENAELEVASGQTVTYPAGLTVDDGGAGQAQTATPADGDAQGGQNQTATPAAGGNQGGQNQTATPAAGENQGGQNQTATPAAGDTQGQQGTVPQTGQNQNTFVCEAGDADPGDTYVTQEDETLGEILNRGGLDPRTQGQGQVNINQVVEFVYLNCGLRFAEGQTVTVPAGIPQTGQAGQQDQTATPAAGDTQGQQGTVPQTGQQAQQQGNFTNQLRHPFIDPENVGHLAFYVARSGDSLSTIARRFNTDIQTLLNMNPHISDPNIIFRGQWILVHPGEQVVVNPPGWQNFGQTPVPSR